jgi:hypothetical protein
MINPPHTLTAVLTEATLTRTRRYGQDLDAGLLSKMMKAADTDNNGCAPRQTPRHTPSTDEPLPWARMSSLSVKST